MCENDHLREWFNYLFIVGNKTNRLCVEHWSMFKIATTNYSSQHVLRKKILKRCGNSASTLVGATIKRSPYESRIIDMWETWSCLKSVPCFFFHLRLTTTSPVVCLWKRDAAFRLKSLSIRNGSIQNRTHLNVCTSIYVCILWAWCLFRPLISHFRKCETEYWHMKFKGVDFVTLWIIVFLLSFILYH